jgi:alkanesulfonate monooxygenase SsuD/methylene tetrahydromethanopterin reductase-like flavin-dependent oxidoreductase (luciferase family)
MLAALGPKTMTWGGRIFDGVMLHTFFTDQALAECVERIRSGAEAAGRDPASVRVWSVFAVLADQPESVRLKMLVGRMATYLQGYGDALVAVNHWDPQVLTDFRAAPIVQSIRGAIDAVATQPELEAIAELIPAADGVILHASTPDQVAPAVDAYRAVRPADRYAGRSNNPGK